MSKEEYDKAKIDLMRSEIAVNRARENLLVSQVSVNLAKNHLLNAVQKKKELETNMIRPITMLQRRNVENGG